MRLLIALFHPWTWRMAWRDSRRDRMRLLFFSLSIMIGIGVLTAAGSLRDNLLSTVDEESRGLLGADVLLESRKPFNGDVRRLLHRIPGEQKQETAWVTAVSFPGSTRGSAFVQLRGVEPGWPFHGDPVTDPPEAWARCQAGEGFVSSRQLLENTGAKTGDFLRAGKTEMPLLGVFIRPPPPAAGAGVMAPEVFASLARVRESEAGGVISFGFHRMWLELPRAWNPDRDVEKRYEDIWRKASIRVTTLSERREKVRELIGIAMSFISLMGFVSAILGGLGVASAMHVHAAQRAPSAAMLRCLGGEGHRVLAVYVLQGIWLGMAGAVGGVLLGIGLQAFLPMILPKELPVQIHIGLSLRAVAVATGAGFLLCASFAALPMLAVQRVPPLAALRAAAAEETKPGGRPRLSAAIWWTIWAVLTAGAMAAAVRYGGRLWQQVRGEAWARSLAGSREEFIGSGSILVVLVAGFLAACRSMKVRGGPQWVVAAALAVATIALAIELSPHGRAWVGLGQAAGVGVGLLLLALSGSLVVWLARCIVRPWWPFTVRQGLASLFRPRNQTRLFILTGGMAAALLLTMALTQRLIISFLESKFMENKPSVILAEVNSGKRFVVQGLMDKHGLKLVEDRPVITMSLAAVKGVPADKALNARGQPLPRWLKSEVFRSTMSASLPNDDVAADGKFTGVWNRAPGEPVPVSVEADTARDLNVAPGDSLTMKMDAGGKDVECRVTSIRTVQKAQVQFWFRLVFPEDAFNAAESPRLMSARGGDAATNAFRAELQTLVPGVLAFDVGDIMRMLQRMVRQVTGMIAGLAAFIIGTGVIILMAIIAAGRRVRVHESVLLRTLGATGLQVSTVLTWEYLLLGLLAGCAGALLACGWTWFLAQRVFSAGSFTIVFSVPWGIVATGLGSMALLTVIAGWMLSRGVTRHPPLSVLREL